MKITREEYQVLFPRSRETEAPLPVRDERKISGRREEEREEETLRAEETRNRELADLGLGTKLNLEG
ncbi:hypothetical protein C8D99_12320 [Aminivibrio pyruvatiphilus]|jgi:hypothetical protein|uniref:Uncharacterized protein n=1 Tax=Aminivibrio pyruvatiphilus TaxID=1005740 RepID=A0A4R8M1B1_9BACT|nr:hypothetical protein [Aminivibrio pyruvatiphilus]TDY55416.1 hypothetical protein C8D99_12320 [Aminivibrio pyruvatiphilus]